MSNGVGSTYSIKLKNSLLTQTHRSIIDALFLYIKNNTDAKTVREYQDNLLDMTIRVEPYTFLKYYLNKTPLSYGWLKKNWMKFLVLPMI
ncbi:hypothetical protein [Campylobacter helveticus]|uniref:hypothetical protein n=1 Tax=Campylobacter helveticus TaxID=28898 RepID=UPI002149A1F9|nr:hypothetical protein [Campylobacter helveticus]MCR2062907.1 hypothetical protein [Campylobacter helveticus]